MATAVFTSFDQQCNAAGDPISGAKITVYAPGTTTPLDVYSDAALSVPATNPIVCDSAGRHDMRYVATGSYKVTVQTSANVSVYTRDDIDGGVPVGSGALGIENGGTGADTASAALVNLGGATAAELASLAAEVAAISGAIESVERTHIATGSTAQRPEDPVEGDLRRNVTTHRWEGYTGSDWENLSVPTDFPTLPAFTQQVLTSGTSQTYTTPANCRAIKARMIGGGGGGNGGGTGGTSSFNSITVIGGSAASSGGGGAGGSGGTGTALIRMRGADGHNAFFNGSVGGNGGSGVFGGGGRGNVRAGSTNTGGGGGGGTDGGGGGSGEYAEIVITSPAATYTYTIGAGGAAGSGFAGGSGVIIVEEYY